MNSRKFTSIAFLSFVFIISLTSVSSAIQPGLLKGTVDRKSVYQLQYENARVDLSFLEGGIVKVEIFAPEIYSSFPSYLTVDDSPSTVWYDSRPELEMLSVDGVHIQYGKKDFSLTISAGNKTLLSLSPGSVEWNDDGSFILIFDKTDADSFFGLGEEAPDVLGNVKTYDQNHKKLQVFNRHFAPSHMILPFFFNPSGYGLYIDNPWNAEFNFKRKSAFEYSATGGPARFYFIAGDDAFNVIERYTALTGKPPIPPRWVTGYMQSRYGYENEKDYRWLMDNFRERELPADVLIFDLDWFGKGVMGNLWWTDKNFPDGPGFQKEIHDRGFRTITIVEPYIFKESYNYESMREKELLTRKPGGEQYEFPFWGGAPAGLMDFSNPATQKWFGEKVALIKESGVDAWWTDLNEPEKDFEDTNYLDGTRDSSHNLQGFLMNKAIFDLYRERYPDDRLFIMSRSGFSGIQRFGSGVWSGDVQASFQHLANQVPIGLAVSMSGMPMFNSDTGGFHNEPSPELFVRWFQFSAFNPVFRSHGNHTIREPWSFGEEAEKICKKYLELRYMMSPYLYTLFKEMNQTGAPIMRPTFMEFPDDPDSLVRNMQFMYGPWILVVPVTDEGAKSVSVYLPPGNWTYMWDEREVKGGRGFKVPVDLDTMPLFVREGAILPLGPVMQYTEEKPVDPLAVHYFPSESPSEFTLYEDDGLTNAYKRGAYSETKITAIHEQGKLTEITVHRPEGSYEGMHESRTCDIVIHHSEEPSRMFLDGEKLSGDDWSYNREDHILTVRTSTCTEGAHVEAFYE